MVNKTETTVAEAIDECSILDRGSVRAFLMTTVIGRGSQSVRSLVSSCMAPDTSMVFIFDVQRAAGWANMIVRHV
jgi:hypothetical protein